MGWPSLWCHLDEVVLILEKIINREDLTIELTGHSHTSSFVCLQKEYSQVKIIHKKRRW